MLSLVPSDLYCDSAFELKGFQRESRQDHRHHVRLDSEPIALRAFPVLA